MYYLFIPIQVGYFAHIRLHQAACCWLITELQVPAVPVHIANSRVFHLHSLILGRYSLKA